MKSMRLIAIMGTLMCLFFISACSSKHKPNNDMTVADANASYRNDEDAQSLGLGDDESSFGDTLSSTRKLASYRTYYFDFDSNAVHDSDKPAIIANARKLANNSSMKALVEGHTDPRGSREYNIGLGERRAKAVAKILMANGAKHNQIRVVSYGAQKPAATGFTEADYQLDRRSVLDYLQQ